MLLSPPDSEELPISFIRGFKGLEDKVSKINHITLNQVKYIGEWHSHPDNYPSSPSAADLRTFDWLRNIMEQDSLPSIMMIIGENKSMSIIGAEPIN